MCSTGYMRMVEEQNEFIELLPVGPMHSHSDSECRAACFSDVVVRKEKAYVDYSKHAAGQCCANNVSAILQKNSVVLCTIPKLCKYVSPCKVFALFKILFCHLFMPPPAAPVFSTCLFICPVAVIVPYQIMWIWYTGHWWVGCYIWYSEEETGLGSGPPRPLLTVYQSPYCYIMVRCSAI